MRISEFTPLMPPAAETVMVNSSDNAASGENSDFQALISQMTASGPDQAAVAAPTPKMESLPRALQRSLLAAGLQLVNEGEATVEVPQGSAPGQTDPTSIVAAEPSQAGLKPEPVDESKNEEQATVLATQALVAVLVSQSGQIGSAMASTVDENPTALAVAAAVGSKSESISGDGIQDPDRKLEPAKPIFSTAAWVGESGPTVVGTSATKDDSGQVVQQSQAMAPASVDADGSASSTSRAVNTAREASAQQELADGYVLTGFVRSKTPGNQSGLSVPEQSGMLPSDQGNSAPAASAADNIDVSNPDAMTEGLVPQPSSGDPAAAKGREVLSAVVPGADSFGARPIQQTLTGSPGSIKAPMPGAIDTPASGPFTEPFDRQPSLGGESSAKASHTGAITVPQPDSVSEPLEVPPLRGNKDSAEVRVSVVTEPKSAGASDATVSPAPSEDGLPGPSAQPRQETPIFRQRADFLAERATILAPPVTGSPDRANPIGIDGTKMETGQEIEIAQPAGGQTRVVSTSSIEAEGLPEDKLPISALFLRSEKSNAASISETGSNPDNRLPESPVFSQLPASGSAVWKDAGPGVSGQFKPADMPASQATEIGESAQAEAQQLRSNLVREVGVGDPCTRTTDASAPVAGKDVLRSSEQTESAEEKAPFQPVVQGKEAPKIAEPAGAAESRPAVAQELSSRTADKTVGEPNRPVKASAAGGRELVHEPIPGMTAAPDAKSVVNPKTTQAQSPRPMDFVYELAGRIQSQLKAGEGEVRIQLRPEFLGNLEIKAETGISGIVARIAAESSSVKQFLENNLHLLQQTLSEQGLKVDRIDVVLQEGLDSRQSANHQHQSGQTGSGQSGSNPNGNSRSRGLPEELLVDSMTAAALGPNSTFHTIA